MVTNVEIFEYRYSITLLAQLYPGYRWAASNMQLTVLCFIYHHIFVY